ncbi:MAG: hypothetical protein Tsb0034_21490 [Ekhidna sp.]
MPKPSPVVRPPESNKPKDTPSIFNRKKQQEEKKDTGSVIEKNEENFTTEDLKKVWKAFGDNWKDAVDTDRLILNKEVTKGEAHEVILHLNSQLEVSFLEKFEVELVQFLRTELKNDYITLKREIVQEEEAKKLYTSKDIFEEMAKQNPNLKDLKDRLGLDFDY